MGFLRNLRALLRSPSPPIESGGFQRTYRTARIAANVTAVVGALTLGPLWADNPLVVLPTIAGLGALLLVDSYLRPRASWLSMSRIDTPIYMTMFVAMGATAAIPFVAVTQAFIGFFFVPPRTAFRVTVVYTVAAWAAITASIVLDMQQLTVPQYLLLIAAATALTVFPAAWSLLAAGAEIERNRLTKEALAEEKDELLVGKDKFVASISHELRTPLTSVVGLAHTLVDPDLPLADAERAELMQMIVRESEEVAAIVEDLLVAARAETGHLTLSPRVVPLVPEFRAVADAVGVDCVAGRLDPVSVIGDPVRIRQIVRNLVTNADRYGGPNVTVTVEAVGAQGVLAVSDDGPGIPPDRLDTVFTAYGRAHDRPGLTDAVGLGLTVSRQLARLMGGDVQYRRRDGWTTFSLALPLATAERATDPAVDALARLE
jgi:signal transduction histidine kinase